jgi:hypothetical protein
MVRTLGPRKAHRELVLTIKRGCHRTAPIFPTPVVKLPVSDSPVRATNSRFFQISFTKCRRGDSTGVVLPGAAVSLRYCHVRLFEELLCCRIHQKLPRGGAFVSYTLATALRFRGAGRAIHPSTVAVSVSKRCAIASIETPSK